MLFSNYSSFLLSIFIAAVLSVLGLNLKAQDLTSNNLSDNSKLMLSLNDSFDLSEQDVLLPQITKLSIHSNNQIAVFGKGLESILIFSDRGKKHTRIGSKGRGPFEFSKLGSFSIVNEFIYVWDKDLLKLSKFSLIGDKILEVQDFRWSVKHIEPIGNKIFFYESGNISSKNYLQEYNLKRNEFGLKFGNRNQTHILLDFKANSGGLTSDSNKVYFASPSSLDVNIINLETSQISKINLIDKEFEVPNINSAREELAKGTENVNELLMKSSYVTNLFVLKDFVVVMAQIGESVFNNELKLYTAENRKIRFYVIDKSTESLIDTFTFSVASNKKIQDHIWSSSNTDLVFLSSYNFFGKDQHNSNQTAYFFNISKASE